MTPDPERVVFGALIDAAPSPLSLTELAALLGSPIDAADAVGALRRDGLANVAGALVFASRAAVRGDQLAI
jgi:hypothetical protein